MDFGRGLAYIRQDPNWLVKTLLGSVISLVPILQFAATGYAMDVQRNVHAGRETPLPEWGENFGERLVRGLLGAVIQLIYYLPMLVLILGFAAVVTSATANAGDAAGDGSGLGGAALCLIPLMFVVGLVCALLGMIAATRYAITKEFGQALKIGQVVAEFRNGIGRWLGVSVMIMVLAVVAMIAFFVTCGLGIFLSFYLTLVIYHWMAQAYRQTPGTLRPAISDV